MTLIDFISSVGSVIDKFMNGKLTQAKTFEALDLIRSKIESQYENFITLRNKINVNLTKKNASNCNINNTEFRNKLMNAANDVAIKALHKKYDSNIRSTGYTALKNQYKKQCTQAEYQNVAKKLKIYINDKLRYLSSNCSPSDYESVGYYTMQSLMAGSTSRQKQKSLLASPQFKSKKNYYLKSRNCPNQQTLEKYFLKGANIKMR